MSSLLISLRVPFLLIGIFLLWQFPADGDSGTAKDVIAATSVVPGQLVVSEDVTGLQVEVSGNESDAISVMGTPVGDVTSNQELKFELWDGEKITFALPDRVEILYTFERVGNQVFVTQSEVSFVDLAQAD